ncbi:hypothetical protein VF21_10305, partial [Pseudogymnoascus sp. 05NY08]
MPFNTATVGTAVTPTVLATLISHYLNRKKSKTRALKPTAHISYDEGLALIRQFLLYASHHTVEELQGFTSQKVPNPTWVKTKEVKIPAAQIAEAATTIQTQLGPEGIELVGGKTWWQWRRPGSELEAEWIEMRADYLARKKSADKGRRVMFYVHGGAYFFGSVDVHRYQLQRHARKLNARVFAPRYRLAPQFPFPAPLQDCLAAYLYLLESGQDASTIVMAGDSAGGGMRPSPSWPPPNSDDVDAIMEALATQQAEKLKNVQGNDRASVVGYHVQDSAMGNQGPASARLASVPGKGPNISVAVDGKIVEVIDQIHMYTTNALLSHPLVSPALQPSLGGLPPLQILTGGGEILRDEQIYLAHKAANPTLYPPPEAFLKDNSAAREQTTAWKPTDVQLQVWDDLCHVAPTLSFTRPAKHMYRSTAQFSAWALARAQKREIEILDDDAVSVISRSTSEDGVSPIENELAKGAVGKAGDPLPPFHHHMIRQRVDRHGNIFELTHASQLPGCTMPREEIGSVKAGPARRWMAAKAKFDQRFAREKRKVQRRRIREMGEGYEVFGGEMPPPSALAGRRVKGKDAAERKRRTGWGLGMWSLWGSEHDKQTIQRELQATDVDTASASPDDGAGSATRGDALGNSALPVISDAIQLEEQEQEQEHSRSPQPKASLAAAAPSAPEKWKRENHPKFRDAAPAAPEEEESREKPNFQVNDMVLAKWHSGDKGFYPARITSITGSSVDPVYIVKFKSYDTVETLRGRDVKAISTAAKRKADGTPVSSGERRESAGGVISAEADIDKDAQMAREREASKVGDGPVRPERAPKKIKANKELEKGKSKWQDWAAKGMGKKGTPGVKKKESMFRTPEGVHGRVGFTGSGQTMRKDPSRSRHIYQTNGDEEGL